MGKVSTIQNSFNAGEWSEQLAGRTKMEDYPKAASKMENFIPLVQGGATVAPGTVMVAEAKSSSVKARLFRFRFSTEQAYIIEAGNQYFRFYKDLGQIQSGGSAYEITTPYLAADLFDICFSPQSADVLWIFHPDYAPRTLSRTDHDDWTLAVLNLTPPPLASLPFEPAADLTPSAVTGGPSVSFTTSAAVFQNGDVNRLIVSGTAKATITSFVTSTQVLCDIIDDFASTAVIPAGSWELQGSPAGMVSSNKTGPVGANVTLTATENVNIVGLVNYDYSWTLSGSGTNEYYVQTVTGADPNISAPSFVYENVGKMTSGTVGALAVGEYAYGDNDGLGYNTIYVRLTTNWGGTWNPGLQSTDFIELGYRQSDKNVFRSSDVGSYALLHNGIVEITGYTSATEVSGTIIKVLDATTKTPAWSLEGEAWSSSLGYPACGTFHQNRLVVAGSTSYPLTVWGSAENDYGNFGRGVNDADAYEHTLVARDVNLIRWLESRGSLVIGTAGAEWRIGAEESDAAVTSTNVIARRQSSEGSSRIQPVAIGSLILFWDYHSEELKRMGYSYDENSYVVAGLMDFNPEMAAGGVVDMAFQKRPYSCLWCVRNDGVLIGIVFRPDQGVMGWFTRTTDGEFESVETIPGVNGYDEVWVTVKRTIGGATKRFVEVMAAPFEDDADTFVSNNGTNAKFLDCMITVTPSGTTASGLDHLNGETVGVLLDGAAHADKVVSSGSITLDTTGSVAHVGLRYTPELRPMRPELATQAGTVQGRVKQINNMTIRFYRSVPEIVQLGPNDGAHMDNIQHRTSEMDGDEVTPLYTGDAEISFPGKYTTDGRWRLVVTEPQPVTVVAAISEIEFK